MKSVGRLGRVGKVLVALAVAGAGFGIATAVQADIPDGAVINACYGKAGTPQKGQLRVRDASQGEACRFYENPLSWNALGPTGLGNVFYASGEVDNVSAGGTIATVSVPPGDYAVSATGWAAGLTAGLKNLRCYIDQPNGDPDDTFLSVGLDGADIGGQESFAVHLNVSRPAGGDISVGCLDSATDGEILEGAQLTATTARALFGATFAAPPNHSTGKASATPKH